MAACIWQAIFVRAQKSSHVRCMVSSKAHRTSWPMTFICGQRRATSLSCPMPPCMRIHSFIWHLTLAPLSRIIKQKSLAPKPPSRRTMAPSRALRSGMRTSPLRCSQKMAPLMLWSLSKSRSLCTCLTTTFCVQNRAVVSRPSSTLIPAPYQSTMWRIRRVCRSNRVCQATKATSVFASIPTLKDPGVCRAHTSLCPRPTCRLAGISRL